MDEYQIPRQQMIERLRGKYKIRDENVLGAMGSIPRHAFVPEAMRFRAYKDSALPIAGNQTISQPYIVAKMTELLELTSRSRVLEIGAGSGYQTVVLSKLASKVFSIERIENLAKQAKETLRQFNITNVTVRCDDGTNGWEIYSPYDAILVAAGGPDMPEPLLKQLKIESKLVIPIGKDEKSQNLIRVTRTPNGYKEENFGPCSFVPLIGEHGW